jgi:hypothetical protein
VRGAPSNGRPYRVLSDDDDAAWLPKLTVDLLNIKSYFASTGDGEILEFTVYAGGFYSIRLKIIY